MNEILFISTSEEWSTPEDLFRSLDKQYHFTLDPCCTSENAKCKYFFTKDDDGLKQSWANQVVFCNPPYGRKISLWIKKAFEERFHGATTVLLLPARTDTNWFYDFLYHGSVVHFLRGRLKFGGSKNPAPFPSMICIIYPSYSTL